MEKSLLDECGLTESDLQSILMANQDNVRVQQVFMAMQVSIYDISMRRSCESLLSK